MEKDPAESKHIFYRKVNYKYVLANYLRVKTSIVGAPFVIPGFATLQKDGWLIIEPGYAWDGPSGPTYDTPDFMAGSCVHDVLYQAMRQRRLPQKYREAADLELDRICARAGMGWFRRKYVLFALRKFAAKHARPRKEAVYQAAA